MKRWMAALLILLMALNALPAQAEEAEVHWVRCWGSTYTNNTRASQASGMWLTTADASSYQQDQYGAYTPENAFDGNLSTTWAEGVSGNGSGEYLGGMWSGDGSQWAVAGLAVWSGYQKSNDRFYKNARPRTVNVLLVSDTVGAISCEATLEDLMGVQYVILEYRVPFDSQIAGLILLNDVYSGSKYQDTCISEMDLLLAPASEGGFEPGYDGAGTGGYVDYDDDGFEAGDDGEYGPEGESVWGDGDAPLAVVFHKLTGDMTYAEYGNLGVDPEACPNVYGQLDGLDIGINGVYALDGRRFTAWDMLEGFIDCGWFEDTYGVTGLLHGAQSVTLVQSELYAWSMGDGVPNRTDEYYLFNVVTASGDTVQLLACSGYEMDGGDWCEIVMLP